MCVYVLLLYSCVVLLMCACVSLMCVCLSEGLCMKQAVQSQSNQHEQTVQHELEHER